jgi:hypothetical protein
MSRKNGGMFLRRLMYINAAFKRGTEVGLYFKKSESWYYDI